MNPEVSIIIPTYNTEAYVAKAIDSVLNQTLTNIEVIVIDDASSDRTLDVIKCFNDPRLHLLQNSQNLGVSASRNRGLLFARGKWVAVLDSDDWYAHNRLEKLLNIAEEKQADLVIDDLYLVQNNESSPWSTLLQESGEVITGIHSIDPVFYLKSETYKKVGLSLGVCKPLFRRSFLNKHELLYDESLRSIEDFHIAARCLLNNASMLFIPTPYYFYRSRPGSLVTDSQTKHIKHFQNVILSLLQLNVVQSNPKLIDALDENLVILKRNFEYYSVIEPFKQKKILLALKMSMQNPYFFLLLLSQLKLILLRRYRYYFLGEKFVFDINYRMN